MRMQQLLSGFEVSQALYVIAELGVATALLDGPRSVDDLAAATGADVDALGRIIRFLASLDVFRRQANRGGHRPRPDARRRPHRFDQGDPPVRPPAGISSSILFHPLVESDQLRSGRVASTMVPTSRHGKSERLLHA